MTHQDALIVISVKFFVLNLPFTALKMTALMSEG